MAFITIFPLFALPVSLLYLPFIPLATSKPASLACTFIQTSAPHRTPPLGCLPSLPNSVCLKLTSAPSVPSYLHSRVSPFLFRSQVKIMIQPMCLVAQHVHNSPDPGDSATVRIFYDTQPVAPISTALAPLINSLLHDTQRCNWTLASSLPLSS